MYDLVLKRGRIADGTGRPAFVADVAVSDGRIAAIGETGPSARRVLDLDGLTVAPGFIDIHTHYDAQIMWDPLATSSCWHGVTTIVMGNCGFTLAPCKPEGRDYLTGMMARVEGITRSALEAGMSWDWLTFPDYLDALGRSRLGVNVACNVGHSTVRYHVMGDAAYEREATTEEVRQMCQIVVEAMAAGAYGFTTSRGRSHFAANGKPVPSRLADLDEIRSIGLSLKGFGQGSFEVIGLRPEEDPDGAFRRVMVELSRETGLAVTWNELNYQAASPDTSEFMLHYMQEAADSGARIFGVARCQAGDLEFDLLENTIIFARLPAWRRTLDTPLPERLRLLRDPEVRAELQRDLENFTPPLRWNAILVEEPASDRHQSLKGQTIEHISAQRNQDPLDIFLDLALEEDLQTEFIARDRMNQDIDAVGRMLQSPFAIPGISDGGAHLATQCGAHFPTHLLARWVRDRGILGLEEAVRKLTAVPAAVLGLRDRGFVAEGLAADLVVFDPDTVEPSAQQRVKDLPGGEERLVRKSEGIIYTVVGGEVLLDHGEHSGAYNGKVLRSNQAS